MDQQRQRGVFPLLCITHVLNRSLRQELCDRFELALSGRLPPWPKQRPQDLVCSKTAPYCRNCLLSLVSQHFWEPWEPACCCLPECWRVLVLRWAPKCSTSCPPNSMRNRCRSRRRFSTRTATRLRPSMLKTAPRYLLKISRST